MPDWSQHLRAHLAALGLSAPREQEIVDELSQHLEDRYQELLSSRMEPAAARESLLAELRAGKLDAQLRGVVRPEPPAAALGEDASGSLVAGVGKDLRYGLRQLRLSPGFALVAILSLALGIGANTAIFQLLDAVRLRTLPVDRPEELAIVKLQPTPGGRTGQFTGYYPDLTTALWEQILSQQQAFSTMGVWGSFSPNLNLGGEAQFARGMWVSGNFFSTLGVPAFMGRLITPADDQRGCGAGGAVVSYSFWQGQLGGKPDVLGSKLTLDGHPFSIIGVTPPSFFGVEVGRTYDVAVAMCSEPVFHPERPLLNNPIGWWLAAVGRLKPGWTLKRATTQLETISPSIFAATTPPQYDAEDARIYAGKKLAAYSGMTGFSQLRKEYESPLWMLMGISGLVLLIACANLANLMLARASARQREMAVRLALGASRVRLIRQLLAESLLLAIFGAIAGALMAQAVSRVLVSFLSTQERHVFVNLAPDWRLLAFTTGLALFTCVLFGLAPALQASATAPGEVLKATGRSLTAGPGRFGLRRALVVGQVAMSLVLLTGALLFVRTFNNLVTLDAGFDQDHLLVADIDGTTANIPKESRVEFKQQMAAKLRALPGVTSAAIVAMVPLGGNFWNENVAIPGREADPKVANFDQVGPGYFSAMRTPLLAGRDFNDQDNASSPLVAVVTETFAKKFFAGANPVGLTLAKLDLGHERKIYQIIGMVKDSKYADLREEYSPMVYVADAQDRSPDPEVEVVVRSDQPMDQLTGEVKRAVAETNPALVLKFRVFRTMVKEGLLRERLMATLSGFFGALAAVLAMIGLYGVISYMVVRRRNEIGIRMALGADRGSILAMVLREAAVLLGTGILIGAALAVAGGSTVRALLYGLTPSDPSTLVFAAMGLSAVAALASLLPAQRASRLDPMVALRDE